jgi:dolichol kinase
MKSLRENDLVATGGQVYGEVWKSGTERSFTGSLEFFVTEKLAVKVG